MRVASRRFVFIVLFTALAVTASSGALPVGPTPPAAEANEVYPPPPPPERPTVHGYVDTHFHQFSNLAFGGLGVMGSAVDPTFATTGLTMADFTGNTAAADAARARALPSADYLYLTAEEAARLTGPGIEAFLPGAPAFPLVPYSPPDRAVLCFATHPGCQVPTGGGLPPGPPPPSVFDPEGRCPEGTGPGQHGLCWRVLLAGPTGWFDLLNRMAGGDIMDFDTGIHGVTGYPRMGLPDTRGWPAYNVLTMQQGYWEWLKRAHDYGLNLIVMDAVNNGVFCELNLRYKDFGCDDDSAVDRQIQAAWDLQAYIDDLSGGPGEGFYRIVRSGEEARREIEKGNLAVVLGVEVDHPFGCTVPVDATRCNPETIRAGVASWYDRGVRLVFPVHLVENGFGSAALYNGIFDLANLVLSRGPLDPDGAWLPMTTSCNEPGTPPTQMIEWRSGLRDVTAMIRTIGLVTLPVLVTFFPFAAVLLAGVLGGLFAAVAAPLLAAHLHGLIGDWFFMPEAPPAGEWRDPLAQREPNCNPGSLTFLGRVLVDELMAHGMVIDMDHTSQKTFDAIMDIAEAAGYAGVSAGHTSVIGASLTRNEIVNRYPGEELDISGVGHSEYSKSDIQAGRIVDRGGLLSLMLNQGGKQQTRMYSDDVDYGCSFSSEAFAHAYLYATRQLGMEAVGFGSDMGGFFQLPAPRWFDLAHGPFFGAVACGGEVPANGPYISKAPLPGQIGYDTEAYTFPTPDGDIIERTLTRQTFGDRTWDYNVDGFANVGSYPDFIADLQEIGLTDDDLAPLFSGAERFIGMWERISDSSAPVVECASVDMTTWEFQLDTVHTDNVTIGCTAWDFESGLATSSPASFVLSTSVPDGEATHAAATGSLPPVCNNAGLCTAVPGVTGIRVDRTTPAEDTAPEWVVVPAGTQVYQDGEAVALTLVTSGSPVPALTGWDGEIDGLTFTDNGDGTATVSGTAANDDFVGSRTVTLTAANTAGEAAFDLTFRVDAAPEFEPVTTEVVLRAGEEADGEGVQAWLDQTIRGNPAPAYSLAGLLPPDIVFEGADASGEVPAFGPSLRGPLAADSGGLYPLVMSAVNTSGQDSLDILLKVLPAITSPAQTVFTVGTAGSHTIVAEGATAITVSGLPDGIGLEGVDNGDGTAVIAGTPVPGSGGEYLVEVTAADGEGGSGTQQLAVTVLEAPTVTSPAEATFRVGEDGSFSITATGHPTPAVRIEAADDGATSLLEQGLAVVIGEDGTTSLAGTPAAGTAGEYAFTVTASNIAGVDIQELTVTVEDDVADACSRLAAVIAALEAKVVPVEQQPLLDRAVALLVLAADCGDLDPVLRLSYILHAASSLDDIGDATAAEVVELVDISRSLAVAQFDRTRTGLGCDEPVGPDCTRQDLRLLAAVTDVMARGDGFADAGAATDAIFLYRRAVARLIDGPHGPPANRAV